jgi:Uma2 family endonuclease
MVATARMTLEEFHALPDDGKRYELIDGEVYVAATPSRKHFWVHRRLLNRFIEGVEGTDWGYVFFAPLEVRLGGPTAVEPDLFVLRRDRLHLFEEPAVVGVPDIVVEVLSPSTRNVDLQIKRSRYERAGVPDYWIADPEHETLTVLVLVEGRYAEVEHRDGRVTSTVVPGLVVEVAPLFARAG